MKSLEFVLNNFKSQCLDGRDTYRLADYTPKDKLHILGCKLKKGAQHTPKKWCKENVLNDLKGDIRFGYDKAVNERGISSALMISVVEMWDWVLTDDNKPLDKGNQLIFLRPNALAEFRSLADKYGISLEAPE